MSSPEMTPVTTPKAETPNNLAYTFQRIHDVAMRLAKITEKPELGHVSYLLAVDGLMNDLDTLRTVQEAPESADVR